MRMIRSKAFDNKKVLLIDKSSKTRNDRTWCFWEKESGFFEDIVYRKWDRIEFLSDDISRSMDIHPYTYKMIRGLDFYRYCLDEISKHGNIEILTGEIKFVFTNVVNESILLNGQHLGLDKKTIVFNSIYSGENSRGPVNLFQHFKGWIIETEEPSFQPGSATFMDFRVDQDHGPTFSYILPLENSKALVEYTLISKNLLESHQYDSGLRNYISNVLNIEKYRIVEEEAGSIPMTNRKFDFYNDGIYNIGTAGGQTKASTGYTFQFIQKQSQKIVDHILQGKTLSDFSSGTSKRFQFYDKIFLQVLYENKLPSKKIFGSLFKKNRPQSILRFLDNESSLPEELKIIFSLPVFPFIKAAVNSLKNS